MSSTHTRMAIIPDMQCAMNKVGSTSLCLNVAWCLGKYNLSRNAEWLTCHTLPACFSPSRHLWSRQTTSLLFGQARPVESTFVSMPGICSTCNSTSIGLSVNALVTSPLAVWRHKASVRAANIRMEHALGVAQ